MDCIVHGVAKSLTRLSDFPFHQLRKKWVLGSCSYPVWMPLAETDHVETEGHKSFSQTTSLREFPGGAGVRILHLHFRGLGLDSRELRSCKP